MNKITSKQILIVAGILLIILIAVGVYFYSQGKKKVTIAKPPLDTPGSSDPINNPGGLSDTAILQLANSLYEDMQGLNFYRDNDLYHQYINLSNTDFVKVYNVFNSKHQADSKATLMQWLATEYGLLGSDFNTVKKDILTRMAGLNLQ